MRAPTLLLPLALLYVASVCVQDLCAQGRRGFRRPSPVPATTPPAAEDKKPEPQKPKEYTAIIGARIYLGTGQVIRQGTLLIADGKIDKVGAQGIKIPDGAKVIDATGKVLSPGFVAVKGSGMGTRFASGDNKVADSANCYDPQIKMGLAAGITAFGWSSGGGGDKPGGKSAVVKLAFGDLGGMVLHEERVRWMRVPLNLQQLKAFRDAVKKAREHRKAMQEFAEAAGKPVAAGQKPPQKPKADKEAEQLIKIMDGEIRLWINGANDNNDLRQALEIARILGVGVVLDGPTTAWSMAAEVAATGSMAIIDPREKVRPDPARPTITGSNIAMANILSQSGVPVAVTPPASGYGSGAVLGTGGLLGQDLNTPHIDAAYAVRGGLDNHKALRTITLDAAKMLCAEASIGSLEPGKDADVLILDGDPLHYRTFVLTAIVNGKIVYEKDKEPFYSHIKR